MKSESQTSIQILRQALAGQYPDMEYSRREMILRQMLFAPQNRMIKIDEGYRLSAEDLRFMTASFIEKTGNVFEGRQPVFENEEEKNQDCVEEYFGWLLKTTSVLKHLNDGFVSQEDAVERESFLKTVAEREKTLLVCLGLYESCLSEDGQDRARFVRYKIQKLREMCTSIQFLTRTGQDVETTRSEYDAAIPYYKYFKNLQRLPFGYDMPAEQKEKLGISHDDDEDLKEGDARYVKILNEMLDEMCENEENFGQ